MNQIEPPVEDIPLPAPAASGAPAGGEPYALDASSEGAVAGGAFEPQAPPPAPKRPLGDWLTMSTAIAAARAEVRGQKVSLGEHVRRAAVAMELADRAMEPIDPLRNGSGVPLAISLYREAAYWALLAQNPAAVAPDLAGALRTISPTLATHCAGGPERLALIEEWLLSRDFVEVAELPADQQLAVAQQMRAFVASLLEQLQGPQRRLGQLLVRRWVQIISLLALVLGVSAVAVVGVQRALLPPDVAVGKPWKTSSNYPNFNPATHIVDGNECSILFHTAEEDNPWFEVDLGAVTTFRMVEVRNRADGFQERALPTIIEISDNHTNWVELGRKTTVFSTWRLSFQPRQARYVRVRAGKKTWLHLEGVSVR